MTTALHVLLTIVITGPAFWCWGHATARVRRIPIGATAAEDEAALAEHDRAQDAG
ncbi:hypothetical protein ACFWR9_42270 [Streptomyces sp. NPDC058534]|uniref:hypothetical protein n=1 Tax=Streptomyces sp. NPDC058534 TaxID=3346541 RepID=UPI003650D101